MTNKFLPIVFLLLGVLCGGALAQQQQATIVPGQVAAIDAAKNQMTLKTKNGDVTVNLTDKTEFKKVSPDNPRDLKAATASSLTEISTGDNVAASGIASSDKKSLQAFRVYLITQNDISKKQQADQAKWTTRGVSGKVTAVNPATNEITVAARGGFGVDKTVVVAANDKTAFRRYAQNSVKYSDAQIGTLSDVKVGDQLRAFGDKSTDGARITAEEVLSGSFRTVAGKIEAIDTTKREITVKDLSTNKSVTVAVAENTLLRRFPPETAQRMAQFQAMRASGQFPQPGQTPNANGGNFPPRPDGAQSPNGGNGRGGFGGGNGGGRGDLDSMLERLPALDLSELKIGDAIAASSSTNAAAPNRVTAIKFVAGIEPFLNQSQTVRPQGGNNRQNAQPSFSIPGLDSIGTP